jgi:hypothetical protein
MVCSEKLRFVWSISLENKIKNTNNKTARSIKILNVLLAKNILAGIRIIKGTK